MSNLKELIQNLSKKELKELIKLSTEKLNSTIEIEDTVTLTIEYMIGDARGYTEKSSSFSIKSQDDLDALYIIKDILDDHTFPNPGRWGFHLDSESFSKKSQFVYNIIYNQEEAPKEYQLEDKIVVINQNILDRIEDITTDCFRGDIERDFLVYQGYSITQ